MKVALLFPKTHDKLYETNVFPLGISYVSSALRRAGFETEFVDGNSLPLKDYEARLQDMDCDILGISSTFFHMREVRRILPLLRQDGRPIVLGGPGVSSLQDKEAFLKETGIDFLVEGEAEETFPFLIGALGRSRISLPGVYYLEGDELVVPERPRPFTNLEAFFPDREGVAFERYVDAWENENGLRGAGIIASRGCPFSCTFCDKSVSGSDVRYRTVDNVLDEITLLGREYGVDYVFFFDHLFTLNKQHLVEFSRKRAERGLDFSWGANAHVNIIDEDYATLLADAGCITLHFGVESGSERILSFYRKRINPKKVISAFESCVVAGIEPGAYFIVGAPDETEEDVEQSARLLSRLRPSFVDVSILAPMPGTLLFESTKHRIDERRFGDLDNRFSGSVYKDLRIDPAAARDYLLSRWQR